MSNVRSGWLWLGALLAACGGGDERTPSRAVEASDAAPHATDSAADGGKVLRCAGEPCELPSRFMFDEPCCLDPFAGGCGVMIAGTCQRYSKRDGRCPAATPDGQIGEAAEETGIIPCCASNGECGIDVGAGLGCVATSQSCSTYPKEFIELLGSQTCDGEPLELPPNCGVGL